jgi:hypothetical protein
MKVIGKLNGENGYSSRTASWTGGRDATGFGATMTGRTGGLESEGALKACSEHAPARESLTGVQWR